MCIAMLRRMLSDARSCCYDQCEAARSVRKSDTASVDTCICKTRAARRRGAADADADAPAVRGTAAASGRPAPSRPLQGRLSVLGHQPMPALKPSPDAAQVEEASCGPGSTKQPACRKPSGILGMLSTDAAANHRERQEPQVLYLDTAHAAGSTSMMGFLAHDSAILYCEAGDGSRSAGKHLGRRGGTPQPGR